MAEKVVSPGVFTNEIDASFLPAAVGEIGGCVIGPTVKGPALVPTVVNSFGDFSKMFGTTFKSGSETFQYYTSHAAKEYLKNGGSLTVVRVLGGSFGPASATVSSGTGVGKTFASSSLTFNGFPSASGGFTMTIGNTDFEFVLSSSIYNDTATQVYVSTGTTVTETAANLVAKINQSSSISPGAGLDNAHGLNLSASSAAGVLTLSGSAVGTVGNITITTSSLNGQIVAVGGSTGFSTQGGTDTEAGTTVFSLETLADGAVMNNNGGVSTNHILSTGTENNIRYEISTKNNKKGTFTLLVRRGDDTIKRKSILETWSNLSLDPNASNYIEKQIGNTKLNFLTDSDGNAYLQPSGSFPNKSKYIRVASVNAKTIDYLDNNGLLRVNAASASLPSVGSGSAGGSFSGGSDGDVATHPHLFYENVVVNDWQGFDIGASSTVNTSFRDALSLIGNPDEYDINLLFLPGIIDQADAGYSKIIKKAIETVEDRADCFLIYDCSQFTDTITTATTNAEARDTNYGAVYYPWVQINDSETGLFRFVPPSTVVPGVYSFNDKVAHPWFAPAGLNRGGLESVVQAQRKLTQANRDTLYESNVNPIATFPGQGVTIFGQKTLQKKSSALDRVNVRRLMIRVKKFIASASRFLVFEQNTAATRQRFLNIVNPFLEQVQSQSGLNAFRVVMDDSNNTPDTIDRNILFGEIFLQPTKTAEFIVLDFTIQPTGATFPE